MKKTSSKNLKGKLDLYINKEKEYLKDLEEEAQRNFWEFSLKIKNYLLLIYNNRDITREFEWYTMFCGIAKCFSYPCSSFMSLSWSVEVSL